jgi:hypothetical protein
MVFIPDDNNGCNLQEDGDGIDLRDDEDRIYSGRQRRFRSPRKR